MRTFTEDEIEAHGWPEEFVCLEHGTQLVAGWCEECDWERRERAYKRAEDQCH